MTEACPACGSDAIHVGKMYDGDEVGTREANTFVPDGLKTFRWTLGVKLPPQFCFCVSCGLLWQHLDDTVQEKLRAFIQHNQAVPR